MNVCVFAGARGGAELLPDAYQVGKALAQAGHRVWFGGSSKGIMGALANGYLEGNGVGIAGVLPESIAQLKHYRTDIHIIVQPDMASRKQVFWQSCDAYLCLPGGFGTLDELFEIATHQKLGHTAPAPIVVLNQGGFYDPLKALFANMLRAGTADAARLGIVQFKDTLQEAIIALKP